MSLQVVCQEQISELKSRGYKVLGPVEIEGKEYTVMRLPKTILHIKIGGPNFNPSDSDLVEVCTLFHEAITSNKDQIVGTKYNINAMLQSAPWQEGEDFDLVTVVVDSM
jgi:hypothetical protein